MCLHTGQATPAGFTRCCPSRPSASPKGRELPSPQRTVTHSVSRLCVPPRPTASWPGVPGGSKALEREPYLEPAASRASLFSGWTRPSPSSSGRRSVCDQLSPFWAVPVPPRALPPPPSHTSLWKHCHPRDQTQLPVTGKKPGRGTGRGGSLPRGAGKALSQTPPRPHAVPTRQGAVARREGAAPQLLPAGSHSRSGRP